ncbi:MAG: HD-GYP domain-containing protein [Mariprofundaceae bacterium]
MLKMSGSDWLGVGWVAAVTGTYYWLIESILFYYFYSPLLKSALFPTDGHELFMRSTILLLIVFFTSYAQYSLIRLRREFAERENCEKVYGENNSKRMLKSTISAISRAVEVRDPYTAGHQWRVAELSVAIAGLLGMDEHDIEELYMGALIHDVGKIQVPTEILVNPSTLNKHEMLLIQGHTSVGYDIMEDSEVPPAILNIIRHHHERLDGSGYPDGLSGDEISMQARIVAVADVVEAMSSDRPYRAALGMEKAIEEIAQGRGRFFDSKVVDACISLIEGKNFSFQAA